MAVNITARSDAAADVPAAVASLIIDGASRQSAALQLFKKIPMNRRQERIRVLTALPVAYWVNGDTGVKQTSKESWADKLLTAEEIAVILPVPLNVIDDADFDLWSFLRPDAEEAIGKALDDAIFFGVAQPAGIAAAAPSGLVAASIAAGNVVTRGTATQANGGIAEDLNQTVAKVEDEGFDVNGVLANRRVRKYLRGARSTQGVQLAEFGPNGDTIMGMGVQYGARGSWPNSTTTGVYNPLLMTGDFSQGILGVRQDIQATMFREGIIQDPTTGEIVYNLMQQDMVALRLTARFGFQVSNAVTWEQPDSTQRNPWAVLRDVVNP